jgi:hypothetical protein
MKILIYGRRRGGEMMNYDDAFKKAAVVRSRWARYARALLFGVIVGRKSVLCEGI